MKPMMLIALAASALATSALAQPTPGTGENAVDPHVVSDAGAAPIAGQRMFEAFHGEAGISRIVDDFVTRMVADPRISEIFKATDLVRLRRTLKEQVCYLLGGPCANTGRDMTTTHMDQGVTAADFHAGVENLQAAMTKEGVPSRVQNRLLARLAQMQGDVVER
ncbi:MAG: group 1 truncated hemoglobin [Phenylobacterium sp.]|uniref:group I truncated hemoglobin n=1 Tax=Phenylobacterium sp. TaxID=1871053 RepID=UPI0027338BAF|nr:group 1 truncated hemoglobin [Phenylobacterium sp.]MDP3172829.1 group 1 truncated hemoglobin [Phenylobacterium sp.]